MAAVYTCDGCGKPVDQPKKVGFVLPRDYCEPCAQKAKDFTEATEGALDNARRRFMVAREALIEGYATDGFKLPDVP